MIEGISAAPVSKEQLVRVDVASDRQSLAHSWVNSVMLMLIQQTGFGKGVSVRFSRQAAWPGAGFLPTAVLG